MQSPLTIVAVGLLGHLQHLVDGAEHVEVGGGAHVALVGREAEHGDGNPLVLFGLLLTACTGAILFREP